MARSSAGRFRGSRCRWCPVVEPHPAGQPDRRSWPPGQFLRKLAKGSMEYPTNVPALHFLVGIVVGMILIGQKAAVFRSPGSSQGSDRSFPALPLPRIGTRMQDQAAGHGTQPAFHRLVPGDGCRLVGQHEKGCLKNVLNVVLVRQTPVTDLEHLRPMPLHQFPECGLVPLARKALEKARIADGLGNQLPHPFRESSSLTHYAWKGRGRMHLFPGKPKLWGRAS